MRGKCETVKESVIKIIKKSQMRTVLKLCVRSIMMMVPLRMHV